MNERVKLALHGFGKTLLALARERAGAQPPKHVIFSKLKFPDVGMPESINEERVLWGELFDPCKIVIPEIAALGKALFEEGVHHRQIPMTDFKGVVIDNPSYEQAKFVVDRELFGIIINYVSRHNTLEYNEEKIENELERYIQSWNLSTVRRIALVPLLHFRATNPIRLTDNLLLKPFTGEMKTLVWSKCEWERMGYGIADFADAQFVLEWFLDQDRKDRTDPSAELERTANLVVTALRLTHQGHVSGPAGAIYTGPDIVEPTFDAWHGNFRVPECEPNGTSQPYELIDNDVSDFLALFQALLSSHKQKRFQEIALAIRRFNLSYARRNHDDELIDLVISLESSLLFPEKQELRYRMALRGAALLRESRNPKECFKFLRDLYDVRSAIVHSGHTLEDMRTKGSKEIVRFPGVCEFIEETREITRQILRTYLRLQASGRSIREINDDLDNTILIGLQQTDLAS